MNPSASYREAAVRGASPVRLVILLYEQAIADLRRAVSAFERGDVETRTREINHAILVIGHLESTLDKQQGGPVATQLEHFYRHVRAGLLEAQAAQSGPAIEQQLSNLLLVNETWNEVERRNASLATPAPAGPSRTPADWKA